MKIYQQVEINITITLYIVKCRLTKIIRRLIILYRHEAGVRGKGRRRRRRRRRRRGYEMEEEKE